MAGTGRLSLILVILLPANDIEVGMVAAEEVKLKTGEIVVSKRQEITALLKVRILQLAKLDSIKKSIKIFDWVEKQEVDG